MEACTIWVPVDRTLVILSSFFMVIGTVHYDRLLFAPYLLWAVVNVVINTILCIILANVIGQIVYVAWIIVCFEFYALFIVYSEFRAIPFKLKTLQEYLDSLQAHTNCSTRVVPDSFDHEEEARSAAHQPQQKGGKEGEKRTLQGTAKKQKSAQDKKGK